MSQGSRAAGKALSHVSARIEQVATRLFISTVTTASVVTTSREIGVTHKFIARSPSKYNVGCIELIGLRAQWTQAAEQL